MFNQNMNFAQPQQAVGQEQSTPITLPVVTYSMSQHYIQPTRPRTPTTHDILSEHNIDSSYLSSTQLSLFENAPPEQRDRLIELWRISPPTQDRGGQVEVFEQTTVEREEELAILRYEKNLAEGGLAEQQQAGTKERYEDSLTVEPYMKSGYEILAERDYQLQLRGNNNGKDTYSPLGSAVGYQPAYDPAFSGKEWWRDFVGQQPMEFQYGMLDQFRENESGNRMTEDEEMT